MEKRKGRRVEFFNALDEQGVHPVWVFQHTDLQATLGLLIDVSLEGVQIISRKETPLDGTLYRMDVYGSGSSQKLFPAVYVNRIWTGDEGTIYSRHGFALQEDVRGSAMQAIVAAREVGEKWLRCELADVTVLLNTI